MTFLRSPIVAVVPFALQGIAMAVDELVFHRRRGLSRWERIGHPLDTLTVVVCLGWLLVAPPTTRSASVYLALAVGSCLFITKDEPVHARECSAGEQWLHAVLFLLHPVVLAAAGWLWWTGEQPWLIGLQLALVVAFGIHQTLYWNRPSSWQR